MQATKTYSFQKALVFLMLGVYVFGLIKPVMPLMEDVLAHTFFKSRHMATVHFENGRYHLHLELKAENKQQDNKQQAFTAFDALSIHVKTEPLCFVPYYKHTAEIHSPYHSVSTDVTLPIPLLPPEC